MATASLYRRILPSPPAIDFASSEGKQLFVEAIQSQTMEGFFKLISYFQTQSEPAYCGLATLTMVLNALAIDPGKKWKGPWRWFDESMLDCCEPLERVKAKGISFGKLVCLAQCSGAKVLAFRTNQSTIDDFRKYVRTCTSSDNCHLISSYHRGILKQTGTGHFSPIGGYHPGKDLALILDVARFKYPPHWIPLTLLWEAMNTVDETSDRLRGFMLISKLERPPALLYTLSCKNENWTGTAKYLIEHVPVLIKSEDMNDVKKVLMTIISSFPSDFGEFIKWVAEVRTREDGGQSLSQEERGRLTIKEEILKQVQETGLYKHVKESLLSLRDEDNLSEIAANVCCQGAGILSGGSLEKFCCREACIKCVELNGGNKHVTLVSGTVSCGTSEQGVDVIVPSWSSSQTLPNCTDMSPTSSDVLTVLLLALPPRTWNGIRNQSLLQEIKGLTLTTDLPSLLQEEVLHLRSQLQLLERCKDDKLEEDFNAPLL